MYYPIVLGEMWRHSGLMASVLVLGLSGPLLGTLHCVLALMGHWLISRLNLYWT